MSLPEMSVKKPVLVNLLVILICVAGGFAYVNMAKERIPYITMEGATVTTILPGASPKEVEELITIPFEEEISKIDEIDEMTSISSEGVSNITIQFDEDIDSVFEKVTEIQNQIGKVRNVPRDAEEPIVEAMEVWFEVIRICVVGTAPERVIKEFVEDLEDELNLIEGVGQVDIDGLREREIWIEVDPHRLYSYGLSLQDVAGVIRRRSRNVSGGTLKMGRGEFTIRTEAEFLNTDQIAETVLKEDGENGYVYVRDVATVRDTFADRLTYTRVNGQPSVILTIRKDKKSNIMELVAAAKAVVRRFEARLPPGTHIEYLDDASVEVAYALDGLRKNFSLGLGLVMISLTLFIGWRPSLLVAIGLPVTFLGTFILMDVAGMTVNMLSLFSLILVLGLIVDDSIVVCENVYRYAETGMPMEEAAIKGTEQIIWPVVATVMTTIAAFLPVLLMAGPLGKFMGIIPVVVTTALVASLFECLVILPSHIADFGAPGGKETLHRTPAWVVRLMAIYSSFVRRLLRFRYGVVAVAVGAALFAIYLAVNHMDFILFGGRDMDSFALIVEAPAGASLAETTRILGELESQALERLEKAPEIESLRMVVGRTANNRMLAPSHGINMGELNFKLVNPNFRERMGFAIREEFEDIVENVSGARTITFRNTTDSPPVGNPVQVRVRGDNMETLDRISAEIQDYLATLPGVTAITDDFPPGKDELQPILDLPKLASLGLDVDTVASEIRGAFEGIEATIIRDGKEEVELMVKHNAQNRRSFADITEMRFSTPRGMTPFSNFGHLERRPGVSKINHFNQRRSINVLAEVTEGLTTSKEANEMLIAKFADVPTRYPGYSLSYGGEYEDTQESLASLARAFIISAILIYVILGGLFQSFFQPFIVMFSVPFAFVGVVAGFFIMDEPLGMLSIIGMIALAGIVVNDSLILIDFINADRRRGGGRINSVVRAGSIRLRPILLTSITTVVGLMPFAVGLFGADELMRPMAMSIVWGLSFATVLTLVVIPCVYMIADDLSMLVARRPLGLTRRQYEKLEEKGYESDESAETKPVLGLKPAES